MAQMVKNLPAMWETWVWSLGWEDPLEEGMVTHSSLLAWNSVEDIIKKFVSIFKKKGNMWMSSRYTVLQCRAHSLVLADKMHLLHIICWGYSVVVLNPVGKSLWMRLAFIPHQHAFCFHLPPLATELHEENMFGLGEWRDGYCWAPAKSLKMSGIFSPPVFEVFLFQAKWQWSCPGLCLIAQLCPTLCNPMDYIARRIPLSMGILQARIVEWVAMPPWQWSYILHYLALQRYTFTTLEFNIMLLTFVESI